MTLQYCFARFRLSLLALGIAAALVPATALAQFDTATVLGTVKDSSGGVVPGATVTLKNVATGITATAVSDARRQLPVPQRPHRHLQRHGPSCRASRWPRRTTSR